MISALWKIFFEICCLRLKPQDLPATGELLVICMLGYSVSSYFLVLTTQKPDIAILSALVDMCMLVFLTYIVLQFWRLPERWHQVTTALTGTGIIFNLIATPLSFLLAHMNKGDPLLLLVFLFVISLLVWNIAVMAHIMRHALNSSFGLGVLVALLYVWVSTFIISSFQTPVA